MIDPAIAVRSRDPAPLAADHELWSKAMARAHDALELAARGLGEAPASAMCIVACAARARDEEAPRLVATLRRVLVRSAIGGESSLRCLRALARAGEPVDLQRLADALSLPSRFARVALAALADQASMGNKDAFDLIVHALEGPLREEAALLLSHLGDDASLDALSGHLRAPGATGIHAARALLARQNDPFAFEVLCERLCERGTAILAARGLWGATADGGRLLTAHSALARWSARGVKAAKAGESIAAAVLTAAGVMQDLDATFRALGSDDDDRVLIGAQASYFIGDAERARSAVSGLFRRGPAMAGQAFQTLARWADLGDVYAAAMLREVLGRRPIDLGRAAIFDALAPLTRPGLHGVVSRAILALDRGTALEAGRALGRLREPPSIIPALWL